mgnify:CR=1 FL=1
MSKNPQLSIIIPNYNEKENLESGVLDEVAEYLKKVSFTWEVIISDDESTDNSRQIAQEFATKHKGFRVLKNPHGGKAQAVWSGIKKATGDIVLFTDMDQSTPLSEVEKLLPHYQSGYDVVFGSRGRTRNASIFRRILAFGFLTFRRFLLLPQVIDTQCGFKSFKRSVALKLFPQLEIIKTTNQAKGWVVSAFDVELLFLAEKFGYQIKEVRVQWKDRDISTSKSKNFLTESKDMLKQILRVKLNDLQGKYI